MPAAETPGHSWRQSKDDHTSLISSFLSTYTARLKWPRDHALRYLPQTNRQLCLSPPPPLQIPQRNALGLAVLHKIMKLWKKTQVFFPKLSGDCWVRDKGFRYSQSDLKIALPVSIPGLWASRASEHPRDTMQWCTRTNSWWIFVIAGELNITKLFNLIKGPPNKPA